MRIFALLLPLLLTACGFALRGADVLPPDLGKLYVNANRALHDEVVIFLEGSSTEIVDTREDAQVILTMSGEKYDRRVLSVDPDTGRAREFELSYRFDAVATTTDGRVLLKPQKLSLRRDLIFDPGALLGATNESGVLLREMRRSLVQQALYKLRTVSGK
jgi:LPS-assembly lipoprotein